MKGGEDHCLCLFTDGWIWGTPKHLSQHVSSVLNEQIFLLRSLYPLSIACLSPRLGLSMVEDGTHLIMFIEPTRHKALTLEEIRKAGWYGLWCQATSRWYPEVQLKIFLSQGLLTTLLHRLLFSVQAL